MYGGPPPTAILEMDAKVVGDSIDMEPDAKFDADLLLTDSDLGTGHATKKRTKALREIAEKLNDTPSDKD